MKNLETLIAEMMGGDPTALEEVSKVALGGNETARAAIHAEETAHGVDTSTKNQAYHPVRSMTWPSAVERGERGPRLGDVAINNEV